MANEMDITHTRADSLMERIEETTWDDVADLLAVASNAARLDLSEPQIRRVMRPIAQEAVDALRTMLLHYGDR